MERTILDKIAAMQTRVKEKNKQIKVYKKILERLLKLFRNVASSGFSPLRDICADVLGEIQPNIDRLNRISSVHGSKRMLNTDNTELGVILRKPKNRFVRSVRRKFPTIRRDERTRRLR